MKKIILAILVISIFMIPVVNAASSIKVQLNGEYIDFTDESGNVVEPVIIKNKTMVPMRKIFEELGTVVDWDGDTRTVTATKGNTIIKLQINNDIAYRIVEGEEPEEIILDSAPVILNNKTMVPVRFIAESLGKQVGWQEKEKAVIIIDYEDFENNLRERASNFFEFLNTDYQNEDLNTMKMLLVGKINYSDLENKKIKEKLNLSMNIESKTVDKLTAVSAKATFSGSGEIITELKKQGRDKFTIDAILDEENNVFLMKSPVLGDIVRNNWIRTSYYNANNSKIIDVKGDVSGLALLLEDLRIEESELNINSFNEIKQRYEMLEKIIGNDNFTVAGTSTKTYTMRFDKEFLFESIYANTQEGLDVDLLGIDNFEMEIKFKVKNNILEVSNISIKISIIDEETYERLDFEITIKDISSSYDKSVKITMPKEKDIIPIELDMRRFVHK